MAASASLYSRPLPHCCSVQIGRKGRLEILMAPCFTPTHLRTFTPAHLHICASVRIRTCVSLYLITYANVRLHTCTPTILCICTYADIYIVALSHLCICVPTHIHRHASSHSQGCIPSHLFTFIHTHLHACANLNAQLKPVTVNTMDNLYNSYGTHLLKRCSEISGSCRQTTNALTIRNGGLQ